jgi:creatinine amidohydrolase
MARAAGELSQDERFPVLCLDYPGLERIAAEICETKSAAPGFHRADEFETSLILALDPGVVRMAKTRAEYQVASLRLPCRDNEVAFG